jgi:hypothetical protein
MAVSIEAERLAPIPSYRRRGGGARIIWPAYRMSSGESRRPLPVTFREVLRGDPFRDELLGSLEKKYTRSQRNARRPRRPPKA